MKQLLVSLALGIGLVCGLPAALGLGIGPLGTYAAGPRYVSPDGNCGGFTPCYTSAQAAVDAAVPGDEIRMSSGTYTGVRARAGVTQVLYISKTVTIRGGYTTTNWTVPDPAANTTVLDAHGQGRVIYITGNISPTVEGLYLTGGNATGLGGGLSEEWDSGGGVYVISATVTFNQNQVYSNTAGPAVCNGGGGFYARNGSVTLDGNTISGNTAEGGGALALVDCRAVLRENTVVENIAQYGGGIGWGNSNVELTGNSIVSNTAEVGGGIFTQFDSMGIMTGDIVRGNKAVSPYDGGGGIYVEFSQITLRNVALIDNQAMIFGSAIGIHASEAFLLHATIANRSLDDASGIAMDYGGTVALTNTILASQTVGITASTGSTATLDGILWFGNGANLGGEGYIAAAHTYTGNPDFAVDGYHLVSDSAAIGKGIGAGVTSDIDNEPRHAIPDLGADEYWLWIGKAHLPILFHN